MSITITLHPPPTPILALRLTRLRLEESFRQVAYVLGLRRQAAYLLAELNIPDSELAKKATALVTEVSPRFLVNHCIRAYLFGAALGLRDGMIFDNEVLYLAAIMHDLGLTASFDGPNPFELEGARAARSFLLDHHYDARKADLIHEAIALHTSVGVAVRREAEVALVQSGSGLDVVGLRFQDLSGVMIKEIVTAYPRLQLKKQLIPLAQQKVQGKPGCPLGALMKLGFSRLVRTAPFAE